MTEAKDNSSLPLLLSITGAVLVVAVGGWFFLDQEPSESTVPLDTRIAAPATTVDADDVPGTVTSAEEAQPDDVEPAVEDAPETDTAPMLTEDASPDGAAELRKARLAADADILLFPEAQSAFHYYGRVLDSDPQHAIALAELDAILTKVAQSVTQHLEAEEFEQAYAIAVLVAKQKPEHSLVVETQQTLDAYTEQLVEQAIQHAQDGDDEQARQVLATAAGLPGRNPDYFTAVSDAIAEIQDARQAAERDQAQRARMAADEAKAAWVDAIRSAIKQGNLIAPAGASAVDMLAEQNSWAAERGQLTGEVVSALIGAAQSYIDAQRLNDAEAALNAAVELGGEPDEFEELLGSLERAFIEAESNRIARVSELVNVNSVAARYPRNAQQRKLSGWVDVYFTVTPTGETADIEVKQSEPRSVFDRAAIAAVEKWAFQPVEYRGQLISKRVATRLVFRLE